MIKISLIFKFTVLFFKIVFIVIVLTLNSHHLSTFELPIIILFFFDLLTKFLICYLPFLTLHQLFLNYQVNFIISSLFQFHFLTDQLAYHRSCLLLIINYFMSLISLFIILNSLFLIHFVLILLKFVFVKTSLS